MNNNVEQTTFVDHKLPPTLSPPPSLASKRETEVPSPHQPSISCFDAKGGLVSTFLTLPRVEMRDGGPQSPLALHLVFRREGGLVSTFLTLPRVETQDGGPQSPPPALHLAFRRERGAGFDLPHPPSR